MTARYRHRYEISPEAAGSRVTYTLTQLAIADPMLRLALPGIRRLTWGLAIPMLASRGLRNLLAVTEERAVPTEVTRPPSNVAGGSIQTEEM
jgi:hypothetical protein